MITVMAIKEAVNRAEQLPLTEGILFERRLFHSLFATEDQKEGMAAFTEKARTTVPRQVSLFFLGSLCGLIAVKGVPYMRVRPALARITGSEPGRVLMRRF